MPSRAPPAANPFQERWSKAQRAPSRSILKGEKKSKNTFRDRRLAEKDASLADHERYLLRLQRERTQRATKRARFSLLDTSNLDAPPLEVPPDDQHAQSDEEDGEEEGEEGLLTIRQTEEQRDEEGRSKTKAEIMQEVVMKSKMHKAKRQQDKLAMDSQTEKLDTQLPGLLHMLAQLEAEDDETSKKKGAGLRLRGPKREKGVFEEEDEERKEEFRYEDVYRGLAGEKRGRAGDRLLTEEEMAEREKEKLLRMEKDRRRRMEGLDDVEEEHGGKGGGDDLEDDFGSVDTGSAEEEEEEEENDDDRDISKSESRGGRGIVWRDVSAGEFWKTVDKKGFVAPTEEETHTEVPFVFKKCPTSDMELDGMLRGRSISQRDLVVCRLKRWFAVSLHGAKKFETLEGLLCCVLMRIERLCEMESGEFPIALREVDVLLAHAYDIASGKLERCVTEWGRRKVSMVYERMQKSSEEGLGEWCRMSDLLVLRCVGRLFPGSDLRHSVCSPLLALLGQAVGCVKVGCERDLALGVLACDVVTEMVADRGACCGEVCGFVRGVLQRAAEEGKGEEKWEEKEVGVGIRVSEMARMLENWEEVSKQERGQLFVQVVRGVVGIVDGVEADWDLILCGLSVRSIEISGVADSIANAMRLARSRRKAVRMYESQTDGVPFRMLNPRFGVRGKGTQAGVRIARALKKEKRGLVRDVRHDGRMADAKRLAEKEVKREGALQRDRRMWSELERMQNTWREAQKKQKKISGAKW